MVRINISPNAPQWARDWNREIERELERVQSETVRYLGTFATASAPDVALYIGAYFYDTSTSELKRSDGTNWSAV